MALMWAVYILAIAFDSDASFNEAMRARVATGYEPQLVYSLSEVEQFLGRAPADNVARFRYGRWLRDTAPNADGADRFFAALAKRAASLDDKHFFQDAAREARAGNPVRSYRKHTKWILTGFFALLVGSCGWFVASWLWQPIQKRWAALVILALSVIGWVTLGRLATLESMGAAHSFDNSVANDKSPISALYLALNGDNADADQRFATMPATAAVLTNRGSLALNRGDRNTSREYFVLSLQLDPTGVAASYGLWRAIGEMPAKAVSDSFRFQHAIRFNSPSLFALPTQADWEDHFAQRKKYPLKLMSSGWVVAIVSALAIFAVLAFLPRKHAGSRRLPSLALALGFVLITMVAFVILMALVELAHPDYLAFYQELL